jgi:outer membrane protein insertion porin family
MRARRCRGIWRRSQTYYQDRGYANFRIDSVQVAIAPDKSDIFITANVTEGVVYKLGEIKLAGNLIVPEAELRGLLLVAPGQTYSQKTISASQERIKNRLGAEGFYFAKVEPVPQIDEAKKIVNLTLFVDPGSRVYVRHINFTGTTRSDDESLRREMRQLEGAWLSNVSLERSKQRLQRLAFVESVEMATEPVPGSPDLVDVNFASRSARARPSAAASAIRPRRNWCSTATSATAISSAAGISSHSTSTPGPTTRSTVSARPIRIAASMDCRARSR